MNQFHFSIIISCALALSSCSQVEESVSVQGIEISVSNFMELQTGRYELWFSFPEEAMRASAKSNEQPNVMHGDEEYVSIGKFNVKNGKLIAPNGSPAVFQLPSGKNIQFAIDAVITYQPENVDTLYTRFLGGAFSGDANVGTAELSWNDGDAFGNAFIGIRGSFFLDAQSGHFNRGIWFGNEQFQNGLTLGFFTSNRWRYEARIRHIMGDDTVASFSEPPQSLVGRTFADGINLADGTRRAEIVARPAWTASSDFSLVLLSKLIPAEAAQKEVIEMENQVSQLPNARVTLRKK